MSRFVPITMFLGIALASGAVLAQAPQGLLDRPSAEAYPNFAGGAPQRQGERNAQARRAMHDTAVLGAGPSGMNTSPDAAVKRGERQAFQQSARSGIPAGSPGSAVPTPGEEPAPGATPQ